MCIYVCVGGGVMVNLGLNTLMRNCPNNLPITCTQHFYIITQSIIINKLTSMVLLFLLSLVPNQHQNRGPQKMNA